MDATRLIALDKIRIDPEHFQVREDISEDAIRQYQGCIEANISLPPIQVAEIDGEFVLVDGFHRFIAHQRHGSNTVRCVIVARNEVDGIRTAITNNTLHGVHMTQADRRRAALMYVDALTRHDMEVSQAEIAKMLGVAKSTVSRWLAPVEQARPSRPEPVVAQTCDGEPDLEPFHPAPTPTPASKPDRVSETMTLQVRVQATHAAHEDLDRAAKQLGAAIHKQAEQPLSVELRKRTGRVDEHIRGLRDVVIGSAPDEVCPACNGTGCKTCGDRGWLSAEQAKAWHDEHDV